ncbi:hypothetical protein L208DRAFT_686253 [Tricholoma matsutake]|nr:hypothetical protein L208DRAFT_686253 [Tricholoma matsutake 945]
MNDLLPSKNALNLMFSTQDSVAGPLQYFRPPINSKAATPSYAGRSLALTTPRWRSTIFEDNLG